MPIRLAILCALVVFLSINLFAQGRVVVLLNHRDGIFVNNNCKKNNTCNLKKVEYIAEDYKVGIAGDYNYGTRFFARLETKSVKDLEKYVFVQFIKGCDFTLRKVNGKFEAYHDISYPRDKEYITFNFPQWTIDSYDYDPVYSTYPGASRFYGYRWNTVAGSFSTSTEKLYGDKKPKIPQVYIVDHPGSAFYANGTAYNISLKFRTCIYKTKDVPKSVDYNDINFAEPINCFEWDSSFLYNPSLKQFETLPDISPICNR